MAARLLRTAVTVLASLVALAALIAGTTTSAAAYTTYTPRGGPQVRLVGYGISVTEMAAGYTVSCSTFDLSGSMISPTTSRFSNVDAATLPVLTSSCASPCTISPLSPAGFAITGDLASGSWPALLSGIKLTASCGDCTFRVEGVVTGRFVVSSQVFTPAAGSSGLHVGPTSGAVCAALDIVSGDPIAVGGYWRNEPPAGSLPIALTNP